LISIVKLYTFKESLTPDNKVGCYDI